MYFISKYIIHGIVKEYFLIFLKGVVVSLPSIIAALGIIINNNRATIRQKNDRAIKCQLELVQGIYEIYNDVSKQFLIVLSSMNSILYKIQNEAIYKGSEYSYNKCIYYLQDISQRAIFFSTYKNRIISEFKFDINIDDVSLYIVEKSKTLIAYSRVTLLVTKLFMVEYYKIKDFELAKDQVVDILKSYFHYDTDIKMFEDGKDVNIALINNMIKDYSMAQSMLVDDEKEQISLYITPIIKQMLDNIAKIDVSLLDVFEEQVASVLKGLLQ